MRQPQTIVRGRARIYDLIGMSIFDAWTVTGVGHESATIDHYATDLSTVTGKSVVSAAEAWIEA